MKDREIKVFNWCWKDRSVGAETTVSGSEFQICEAATGKARPPIFDTCIVRCVCDTFCFSTCILMIFILVSNV